MLSGFLAHSVPGQTSVTPRSGESTIFPKSSERSVMIGTCKITFNGWCHLQFHTCVMSFGSDGPAQVRDRALRGSQRPDPSDKHMGRSRCTSPSCHLRLSVSSNSTQIIDGFGSYVNKFMKCDVSLGCKTSFTMTATDSFTGFQGHRRRGTQILHAVSASPATASFHIHVQWVTLLFQPSRWFLTSTRCHPGGWA